MKKWTAQLEMLFFIFWKVNMRNPHETKRANIASRTLTVLWNRKFESRTKLLYFVFHGEWQFLLLTAALIFIMMMNSNEGHLKVFFTIASRLCWGCGLIGLFQFYISELISKESLFSEIGQTKGVTKVIINLKSNETIIL